VNLINSTIFSFSPSAKISTRPSGRFLVQPVKPSLRATSTISLLKKTPWTMPLMIMLARASNAWSVLLESGSRREPVIELVSCSLQLDRWRWGVSQLSNWWSWLGFRRRRLTGDFYKFTNQRLSLQSMNGSEGP